MAFPTTGILDNFNRSNTGPPPSASWSSMWSGSFGQFEVASNQCAVDGLINGYAANYWNVATYGADAEAYATIVTKPANGTSFLIIVRGQNLAVATPDGYILDIGIASGTDVIYLKRLDDGVIANLDSTSQEISAGDSVGISAVGNVVKAWHKPAAGSWTEKLSVTDSTYSSAGHIAILTTSAATVIDDFGGGKVAFEISVHDCTDTFESLH